MPLVKRWSCPCQSWESCCSTSSSLSFVVPFIATSILRNMTEDTVNLTYLLLTSINCYWLCSCSWDTYTLPNNAYRLWGSRDRWHCCLQRLLSEYWIILGNGVIVCKFLVLLLVLMIIYMLSITLTLRRQQVLCHWGWIGLSLSLIFSSKYNMRYP